MVLAAPPRRNPLRGNFAEQADVPPPSASTRVLIVEDNELNLELLNDILDMQCNATIVTGDGAAAFDLARRHHPDLILLDISGTPGAASRISA
jgi:response regulator RpfG family c-di-GMP phosphodiesterase